MPEKARLLQRLLEGGFNVPPFIYIPADDFSKDKLEGLTTFLKENCHDFKVIVRSAHPLEHHFKGGTFDSLETYADSGGIKYARLQIISRARTKRRLSLVRQQRFNNAPELDLEDMGVIVMPFISGSSIMAKMMGAHWEFGYSAVCEINHQTEPFITQTPHDRRLLQLSEDIQAYLGFKCEIEYIVSRDGEIFVVQAKDISHIETLEQKESERAIKLDGVRRIRRRRSYRERPIFVMDNRALYLEIIGRCEDLVLDEMNPSPGVEHVLEVIEAHEKAMEDFALRYQRFAVLGLSIDVPGDLFQVANHYLDDTPEMQQPLSKALYGLSYKIDQFLAESDTLIARDRMRRNLCSHDAYGVDTVRNPWWSVYWFQEKHEAMIREFRRLGFKTGDMVGLELDFEGKPTAYRL